MKNQTDKDTGSVKPFRITVLCNREGRGYFSAQRHFPTGKPIVLEVLPQEEDPAPPAGHKVNPTHIGLRSHRQLMEEAFLSVRDGGEFPAAAQVDGGGAAPALTAEIQAKLQQLVDLDLEALGELPGRVDALLDVVTGGQGPDPAQLRALQDGLDQLGIAVESVRGQLDAIQEKIDVLHPGPVDDSGKVESVATLAQQVADLQAAVDQIPARLDGFAQQMQQALDAAGVVPDEPAAAGESAPPPAPPTGTPAPASAATTSSPKPPKPPKAGK